MDNFLEILKYILPSLIMIIGIWIILKHFSGKESEKNKLQLLTGNQKYVTPVRLQAYERVILLLERITIESLALRIQKPNMKSIQLQILMLGTVRKEFNHNLSQQLYISTSAWLAVKNAMDLNSFLALIVVERMIELTVKNARGLERNPLR